MHLLPEAVPGAGGARVDFSPHRTVTPMAAQLLLGTPDEVALALACAFGNPVDLLRLACACRRYRLKIVAAAESCDAVGQARSDGTGDGSGGGGTDDGVTRLPPERWSIASEAARRWLAGCPAVERGWVPKRPGATLWDEGARSSSGPCIPMCATPGSVGSRWCDAAD